MLDRWRAASPALPAAMGTSRIGARPTLATVLLGLLLSMTAATANGPDTQNDDVIPVTSAETGITQYLPASRTVIVTQRIVSNNKPQQKPAAGPAKHYELPPAPPAELESNTAADWRPLYVRQAGAPVKQNEGQEVVTEVPSNNTEGSSTNTSSSTAGQGVVTLNGSTTVVPPMPRAAAAPAVTAAASPSPAAEAAAASPTPSPSPSPSPMLSPSPAAAAAATNPSPSPQPSPSPAAAAAASPQPNPSAPPSPSPSPSPAPAAAPAATNKTGTIAVQISTAAPAAAAAAAASPSPSPAAAAAAAMSPSPKPSPSPAAAGSPSPSPSPAAAAAAGEEEYYDEVSPSPKPSPSPAPAAAVLPSPSPSPAAAAAASPSPSPKLAAVGAMGTSPSPAPAVVVLPSPKPLPSPSPAAAAAAASPSPSPKPAAVGAVVTSVKPSPQAAAVPPSPKPAAAAAAAKNASITVQPASSPRPSPSPAAAVAAAAGTNVTTVPKVSSAALATNASAAAAGNSTVTTARNISSNASSSGGGSTPEATASEDDNETDTEAVTGNETDTGSATDYSGDEDYLPTVIEPDRSSNDSSSSSNATKTPIPVVSAVEMPPSIMPAPVQTLVPAPAGQKTANVSAESDLATTVVTVRAPPRTPVTVKVKPGGPNTAVDVTVDDSGAVLNPTSNSTQNAPVTVQVEPQDTTGNSSSSSTMGITAMNTNMSNGSGTAGPSTPEVRSGLQPVMTTVTNNSPAPSAALQPGPAAQTNPKTQAPNPEPWIFKQSGASNSLDIGCILPFEGPQQVVGEASMKALQMAVTDWAPKLVPKSNINLTCVNTKCTDVPAFQGMTQLANDRVVAVIGEVCSGASVAAAGVANQKKLPLISPASTSASLSQKDYFFRTVPSDRNQGAAASKLMYQNGIRAVGLVYEDSTYGYGLAFNLIAAFTNAGGTVPSVYKFAKGTSGDPQAAVQQMMEAKKNQTQKISAVFISTNNLDFVAEFLKAAAAANLDLPIYGGDSLASPALFDKVKGSVSDISRLLATMPAPGTDQFVQDFAKFSKGQTYSSHAAHAYDAMVALLKSIAAAKTRDGPAIIAELAKQDFQGVSGPMIQFDEFGDLIAGEKAYAWVKFDETSGQPVTQGYIDARRRKFLRLRL